MRASFLPKDVEIALGVRLLRVLQFVYEKTDGRLGSRLGHVKLLLLRVPGRRSGQVRTVELLYIEDGDNLAVVGSKGGSDSPPAWLLNLEAHPEAEVQVGIRRWPVVARIAGREERGRLWQAATAVWPGYNGYQARSAREIPIVILEPAQKGLKTIRKTSASKPSDPTQEAVSGRVRANRSSRSRSSSGGASRAR